MIEYIYFVKCPNCEDEYFYFFDEAKDHAMSCLSQKPIITQVEVNRNDFGECTDSADLGTVWSWEDMMKTDDEPAVSVFTRDDLVKLDPGCDPEFDSLDNSLDSVPDNFRKPVPADMTVEDLVEELEENEDTVECKWCNELFDKSECCFEVDLGWLCDQCQAAIKSRGETLTFREGPVYEYSDNVETLEDGGNLMSEAFNSKDTVDFEYDSLTITVFGQQRDVDDWDEFEHTDSYTYTVNKQDVANDIWENFITEADVKSVSGGLETLEDDAAWNEFLATNFDTLLEKYYDQLLEYYREAAAKEFSEKYSFDEYVADRRAVQADRAYDEQRDAKYFGESAGTRSMLEELEEPDEYRKRLAMCPECGDNSFDHESGICINCGFN